MNEAETRAEHIDPALKAADWGVIDGSRILREYHITPGRIEGRGRRGTPEIADYVLVYRNIKLAVNEAKAWDKAITEGVAQAKVHPSRSKRSSSGSRSFCMCWRRESNRVINILLAIDSVCPKARRRRRRFPVD